MAHDSENEPGPLHEPAGKPSWFRESWDQPGIGERLARIEQRLEALDLIFANLEGKMDAVIEGLQSVMAALDGEEQDDPGQTLDGDPLPGEREPGTPL